MTHPDHTARRDAEILRVWATNPMYRALHPAPRLALEPAPPAPRRRNGAGRALRRRVRRTLARAVANRAPARREGKA